MEKFHRKILYGERNNPTNLLAYYIDNVGDGPVDRDDHMLHCYILEGQIPITYTYT